MNKLNQHNQPNSQNKMGVFAIERRKHPRFSIELPLNYSRIDGEEIYGGIVANASEGGILAYLPEKVEIGAVLKIEIVYVMGLELNTIVTTAIVVWSDWAARESWEEYRYGLQFQHIDEKDANKLMALLEKIGK